MVSHGRNVVLFYDFSGEFCNVVFRFIWHCLGIFVVGVIELVGPAKSSNATSNVISYLLDL